MSSERLVRVFISSTFSDFVEERDWLKEKVFPNLERYCEAHGGKFQAVDLRWGVSREDSLTHKTMEMCLHEIERGQKLGSRPNLLIMVGDRYGWEPLPNKISIEEFNQLVAALDAGNEPIQSSERQKLLHKWYGKDENAEPHEYLLLDRTGEFQDSTVWQQEEEKLLQLLRDLALRLGWENDPSKVRYFSSATEQEIMKGLAIDRPQDHVLGIIRHIVPIQGLQEKPGNNQHTYAQSRLELVKNKLKETINDNLLEFSVSDNEYKDYLDRFGKEIESSLKRLIDRQIVEWELPQTEENVSLEIEKHCQFSLGQMEFFTGRDNELERIYQYIHDESASPLFIIAEPGAGKSALLATAVSHIRKANPDSILVNRFIGVTSASFHPVLLVQSMKEELNSHFSHKEQKVNNENYYREDFTNILNDFMETLEQVSRSRNVLVFIDAINQLHSEDQAVALIQKISRLPKNVKVIMTATADFKERNAQSFRPDRILPIRDMSGEEADILLTKWLSKENRTLQAIQKEYVLAKFAEFRNPLFLKLIFEKVKLWMSWYDIKNPKFHLKPDSKGSIETYLEELEATHGHVMTAKSLLYLAISRNGLSEQEWGSLILKDEDIIREFNKRSPDSTDVAVLPMHIFSRFFYDIQSYLAERWNEEEKLLTFFHGIFKDSIIERYLHENGQWEMEIRNQLLTQFNYDQDNFRKIEELPWQALKLGEWEFLLGLLKDEDFLIHAWIHDHYGVYRYWAAVEENTPYKKQKVYMDILNKKKSKLSIPFLICCASILHDTDCYDAALEFYKPLLNACMKFNDWHTYGVIMEKACLAFEHLGVKLYTLMTYERLENIARTFNDTKGVVRLLNHQARIYREEGKIPIALKKAEQAEEFARNAEYNAGIIASIGIQAKIYKERGNYQKALLLNKKAETIALEQENPAAKAMYINNQALILKDMGNLKGALKLYKDAECIARDIGDYSALVAYLNNQGRIYRDLDELPAALAIYDQAEEIAVECGLRGLSGVMKMNKGVVYEKMGQLDDALQLYQESEGLVTEAIFHANSLNSQGRIYQEKRNFDQALTFYGKAENIARSCQSYVKLKTYIENQGSVYFEKEDFPNAQRMYKKAEKVDYLIQNTLSKINRNDECPCGSGLKFKKCCKNKQAIGEGPGENDFSDLLLE